MQDMCWKTLRVLWHKQKDNIIKPLEIWFMDVEWINMDSGQGPVAVL